MKKDEILLPDGQGTSEISRRKFLVASGAVAAGYAIGQLAMGATPAFAQTNLAPSGCALPLDEWPSAWSNQATFDNALQTAAIRGHNQFRAGGG